MTILSKMLQIYWKFASPEQIARHKGVKVGNNCFINTRNWDDDSFLITTGNNVGIAANVSIHCHGGARVARRFIPDFDSFLKVVLEDLFYLGAGSQIMPGVTIGCGSLVAAGSIVTKSVPSGVVVAGNPVCQVSTIEEFISNNKKYNLH